MHFENALLEAFHYHPIAMWLLVASIFVCLGGMWAYSRKKKKFKYKAWKVWGHPDLIVQHNFPNNERKETE